MSPVVFFDNIRIETPRERIYRRLGYRRGVTRAPETRKAEVEKGIDEARSLIRLRGSGLRLPLQEVGDSRVIIAAAGGSAEFTSRRLARFLKGCREVLLMGATAGREVMDAVGADVTAGNMTRAVILDAAASETVDAALDWIGAYFAREMRRENRTLTKRRYSAGYGDFRLENQAVIFKLLEMEKNGVSMTDNFLLLPEKSVTALAGVRET